MNRTPGQLQRNKRVTRPRGQPLVALGLLMVSWVGARAALWEQPAIKPDANQPDMAAPGGAARPDRRLAPAQDRSGAPGAQPTLAPQDSPRPAPTTTAGPQPVNSVDTGEAQEIAQISMLEGHQQLLFAANQMPLAERETNMLAPPEPLQVPAMLAPPAPARTKATEPASQPHQARWSGDSWLLLRSGGNGFNQAGNGLPGAFVPAGFYGGSQVGAVLRYRLAPASAWRPTLYLRLASGIERPRGEEAALGLSFRPVPKVPVALMLEGRATRTTTGTIVRPAAAVVTELQPFRLPLGTRGGVYLQAGYVGGRDGTAFVDGQARIEKPLAELGKFRLRAGGGTWGGAQRGAKRLDVGPTATLEVPVGPANSRLSADYRFRVAGDAAPGSGPVVTLSVGF